MIDYEHVVRRAISEEFHVPVDKVQSQTTARDVPGWDSFSHGSLVMRIEAELGVELPLEEAISAANVGELIAIVGRALR